ncbi:hypothetical protein CC78DRAFT_620356 [Lojkania enalia]|uniref:N-acetyltransferase domain-containing protein n=1 Tax=Lojkania enalia TaxID=147567 RepID=A0A9P4K1D6_9PLEO|nr:hypothetical protein CC78DRAFT_620356 [Didymosphaeria enalia]
MPLQISLVTDEKDFSKIVPMDYAGWQEPYNPQLKHFRPHLSTPDLAIATQKARITEAWRKHDPSKRFYLKVEDTDTELSKDGEEEVAGCYEIVGTAIWEVNEGGGEASPVQATWYPEGSVEREFAERFINGLWAFLAARVTGRHMDLLSIVVHTQYRKRGVGRMLIRWGIDKADELGIETVVSSLPSAKGAYERCGLGAIEIIPADVENENPSERWKELASEDLSGWLLWRPIGRDYIEGHDKAPWVE